MVFQRVRDKCCIRACLLAIILVASAAVFLVCTSATAFFRSSVPGEIYFSPDSSRIAFFWLEQWSIPMGDIYRRKAYVYWCNTNDTDTRESIELDTIGKEYSGYVSIPTDLKFSPDSRHMVLLTPNHLSLINLDIQKLSRLCSTNETVTSFQWLDNEIVGYATLSRSKDKCTLTFWKQNINDSPDKREQIHCEVVSKNYILLNTQLTSFPMEYWSSKTPASKVILGCGMKL